MARWDARQADGSTTEVRYTRFPNGSNKVEYLSGNLWLSWDDKSGVQIGEVPVSGLETALPQRGGDYGPPIVSPEAGIVPAK